APEAEVVVHYVAARILQHADQLQRRLFAERPFHDHAYRIAYLAFARENLRPHFLQQGAVLFRRDEVAHAHQGVQFRAAQQVRKPSKQSRWPVMPNSRVVFTIEQMNDPKRASACWMSSPSPAPCSPTGSMPAA